MTRIKAPRVETFTVRVSEQGLAKAIAIALLYVNEHHSGCLRSSCPVGAELREVGVKAAPFLMDELLGVGNLVR